MNIVTPKRFTIEEHHQLIELGFLKEGDHIELIRGELMQMVAKGTHHTVCVSILCRQLDRILGDRIVIYKLIYKYLQTYLIFLVHSNQ